MHSVLVPTLSALQLSSPQCPGDKPVCDTGSGTCFSSDGKTSTPWISKDPAQYASTAEDIMAAAAAQAVQEDIERAGIVRRAKEHFKPHGLRAEV